MFSVKDYLLANGLAEESEWGITLVPQEKSIHNFNSCEKVNGSKLTECECKIYFSVLINYFQTYEILDCFKFYLFCKNDLWDISCGYYSNTSNPYDEDANNIINYLHDIMIIVLPKVSGLNHLANNLVNDWKGN